MVQKVIHIRRLFLSRGLYSAVIFLCVLSSQAQQGYGDLNQWSKNHFSKEPTGWKTNTTMGAHADDIMRQNQQMMAGSSNRPIQAQIEAQLQAMRSGKTPELTAQQKQVQELNGLINENNKMTVQYSDAYYQGTAYKTDFKNYTTAFETLKSMLEGKTSLSIADAYFITETAYGNVKLTYEQYHNIIKENTDFIKQWLTENGYNLNDPEALHSGIQKFISDTLFIGKISPDQALRKGHMPFYYDYLNYSSDKRRENYFVTKTLSTGGGQCHTLPVSYLIFAEALGVDAFLAYNPVHSFIRFKNNSGAMLNYETTVDRLLPDQFYLETLPVMAKAKQNKIYINSMSKKQVVASVMIDLAVSYVKEHWLYDKEFISKCMNNAASHFPGQDFISEAYNYLNKKLYVDEFNSKVQEKGIKEFKQIEQYPDVMQAYTNLQNYMDNLRNAGVQGFPEGEYIRMMEYYDVKGKLQKGKKIDGNKSRNLFFNQ